MNFMKHRPNGLFITSALQELAHQEQQWALIEEYDDSDPPTFLGYKLHWNSENLHPDIPLETVIEKAKEYKEAYLALEYQRLRVKEYPSIQEQLDMQYWDSVNGTTVWKDTISAIKNLYTKK